MTRIQTAREQMISNAEVMNIYRIKIHQAESYLKRNYVTIDEILISQLTFCDSYRKVTGSELTDDEILEKLKESNEL